MRGLFVMSRSRSRFGLGLVSKGLLGGRMGYGLGTLLLDTLISRLIRIVVLGLVLWDMRVLGLDHGDLE